jgi:hypothetical protein
MTRTRAPKIYFSDFFAVNPELVNGYGAFNISLINDLPLFIDPFLLFDSENSQYVALHDEIIKYLKFLRDACLAQSLTDGQITQWFLFREVKQNWLGFSGSGNSGTGLNRKFADALIHGLRTAFADFGAESITTGSHLEKLSLLSRGVGRDHLSDFTTNLTKRFLLEYTQTFATQYLRTDQRHLFNVERVRFDYERKRWVGEKFDLPCCRGDFVLLTPKDILTRDEAWISRGNMLDQFYEIRNALPDNHLRAQVNDYFMGRLGEDATSREQREAAAATVEKFPIVLDYYIKQKEDNAPEAHAISDLKVRETETQFVAQVQDLVTQRLAGTVFYELGNSFEESLRRIEFLKDVIENKDGHRLFYVNGKPIEREADLHIMYRLTWFATRFEVDREVNNGRGPVDFKISKGNADKSLVEFKLASNSQLKRNLKNQVAIYEKANDTNSSIKVIVHFSDEQLEKVLAILSELKLIGRRDIILIDANSENKPSASKA